MEKKLLLGALNCQGLEDKIDQTMFMDLLRGIDILGVSETWLKDSNASEISIPGYKFCYKNRKLAARGGVGLFMKKDLYMKKYVTIRDDLSDENFLWCKVKKEYLGYQEDLYICMVYIPPEYSSRELRQKNDYFRIQKQTFIGNALFLDKHFSNDDLIFDIINKLRFLNDTE